MPSKNISVLSNSYLAEEIGTSMLERLELMTLQPEIIVDLSSENGRCIPLLKKRYPKAEIKIEKCAETEILPLKENSVDLIFANLLLPWCLDLKKELWKWRQLLRVGGLLIFSSLGPDSLIELRAAYSENLLLQLLDMHDLGDELIRCHFQDPVLEVEYLTVTYREQKTLLKELQEMGMLSLHPPEIRLTKNADGIYPITYEVIYGHAFAAEVFDSTIDESGVVKFPLAKLRGRKKL